LYPGFNAAYANGAPGWSVPYDVDGDTFGALWNLSKGVGQLVQIATWNDYTEGTMIEPSTEFGYKYLTTLQKLLGVSYGQAELEIVRLLYDRRKAGDAKADAASQALNAFDLAGACAQLGCKVPTQTGSGGSAGSPVTSAGSQNASGGNQANGAAGATVGGTGGASSVMGGTAGAPMTERNDDSKDDGGCSLHPTPTTRSGLGLVAVALLIATRRRRRVQSNQSSTRGPVSFLPSSLGRATGSAGTPVALSRAGATLHLSCKVSVSNCAPATLY
jgi:MYXO-CTERM domain-containing protein